MLAYNCGSYKVKNYTLFKMILNGENVYEQWTKYAWLHGKINKRILKRRKFERDLFYSKTKIY